MRRSMLGNGLRLVLRHPGAVVWTYLFSLGIAVLFSLRLHAQLSSLLDHSIAAQSMNAAFDLGTASSALARLGWRVPSAGATPYLGLPVYFLIYFVLTPGTLFSYRPAVKGRLALLVSSGLYFFWRFVRITLLTLLVSAILLVPLILLQTAWMKHVDEHVVGVAAIYHAIPGWVVIALMASLLRLYFDLVEVYTVQLDDRYRPSGVPDRRVRKTLIPAAKTLWRNLPRALGSFVLLALVGGFAVLFTGRVAVDMLAQPRVWPAFLVVQVGMFVSVLTRYWQRGAETVLALDYLLPLPLSHEPSRQPLRPNARSFVPVAAGAFPVESGPGVIGQHGDPLDPIPNPEPAAPFEPERIKELRIEPEDEG